MYEIEKIPGPCAFCYAVFAELKRIPGMCGDGICETCDEIRAFVLDHRFVPWDEQKVLQEKRQKAARRTPAPPPGTARIPHPVQRAYQELAGRGQPVMSRRAG